MHKRNSWVLAALVLPTLSVAGFAVAQGNQAGGARPQPDHAPTMAAAGTCQLNENEQTRAALGALHAANLDEIATGKIAQTRAASPEVKQFADHMVQDHTQADAKLTELARRKSLDLAPPIDRDPLRRAARDTSQAMTQELQSLSGAAFDVNYVAPQAAKHEFVLNLAQQAQAAATDQDVKDLLSEMQQTIRDHRRMAMALTSRLTLQPAGQVGGGPSGTPVPSSPESTGKPNRK